MESLCFHPESEEGDLESQPPLSLQTPVGIIKDSPNFDDGGSTQVQK